jgi:hypothetical protein
MAHYTGINQEVHNYMTHDIPNSLKSNSSAQAMKTRNRVFQVSSTSQSQSSGGVILFNVAPSNFSISRGTMALKCRVSVTGGALANTAGGAVGFQGCGAIASNNVPAAGNGYSWMNRITVYGSNSAVLEQVNYLNDNMNLLLQHNSSPQYLTFDAQILAGVNASFIYKSATNAIVDLVIPLPLSIFNSSTQDFPAYLLSAPLTIQIDLASVGRALFAGATAAVTEYNVEKTFLIFQACELPASYVEAERAAVKSSPYIMNITNSLNVQVPASILSSYTLGLNCSSLRAVFVLASNGSTYASTTQLQYIRDTGDALNGAAYTGAGGSNAIVFVDGNQINSAIYDSPAMVFQGLKNALHHNLQASVLQPSVATSTTFLSQFYAIGWDLTSFSDEGSLFAGTACTNLNIQLTDYARSNGSANLCTILACYDVLVCFEADGTIQTKR